MTILDTCTIIIIENKHAEAKKISVKVQSWDESEELVVEFKMLETPPLPPPRLRRSTPTLSPLRNILMKIKNNHAEPKKIAVKVFGERTRTEETDTWKQNAGNIALTAPQNT
jgi:hypothetical protein